MAERLLPIERQLLAAAKDILCNRKLKAGDLLEWSTSREKVQSGLREIMLDFESDGLYAAFPSAADKRK